MSVLNFFKKNGYGVVKKVKKGGELIKVSAGLIEEEKISKDEVLVGGDESREGWGFSPKDLEPYKEEVEQKTDKDYGDIEKLPPMIDNECKNLRKVAGKAYRNGEWVEFEIAYFHQWGSETCEDGEYTVAIIELEDGSICCSTPEQIKFI